MYREGAAQEEEEKVQPVGATVQLHWFHLSGECTALEDITQKCINCAKMLHHIVSNEKDTKNIHLSKIFCFSVATNKAILHNSLIFVNANKLVYREAHYQM